MPASPPHPEARIVSDRNTLVVLSTEDDAPRVEGFCGQVVTTWDLRAGRHDLSGTTVYLCGDLAEAGYHEVALQAAERGFVIRELSRGSDPSGVTAGWPTIDVGRVPILVHGAGVLFPRFFDTGTDYFRQICAEHAFQDLTQSTKPGRAHRTGIYLTPVERIGEDLHFRLLRCSTNLAGPTETFRATDTHIVDALNQESRWLFDDCAPLNHVLAQVYHNTPPRDARKQTKAKINAHADKTKDMPENAVMAFCTFYDGVDELSSLPGDPFDRGHGRATALTQLIFRRKRGATGPATMRAHFTVTLYPDSVFFIPLSTNRWYTHELRPSSLDAGMLPTRLGYVVRCSNTEAVHRDGQTYLQVAGHLRALQAPTPEGMAELRRLYAEENRNVDVVDYADRFSFSMNGGDYLAPIV